MADFIAGDLVDLAKARFGESVLRGRMRGAGGDSAKADLELEKIADGVIARVRNSAMQVGWPLPGLDPDTQVPYREIWPANLLQMALDLFNWRSISGLDAVSTSQQKVGLAAEEWFVKAEMGGVSLGLMGSRSDSETPTPVGARDRQGHNLIGDGAADRANVLDSIRGWGWDIFH